MSLLRKIKAADVCLCAAALGLSVLMVFLYRSADEKAIEVLLWPHAKATEVFYNIDMAYIHGAGYSAPDASFFIGRECMGSVFICMMFCMLVCAFICRFRGAGKLAWFVLSLIISTVTGIIVSVARIIGSVPFVFHEKFTTLHTGMGAAAYFIAMIGVYLLISRMIGGAKHEVR